MQHDTRQTAQLNNIISPVYFLIQFRREMEENVAQTEEA